MKTSKNRIFGLLIIGLIFLSACDGGDTPTPDLTPEQEVVEGLSKSWAPSTVTFDNQNLTTDWSQFKLTFSKSKSYVATALSDESILVWPASGTYTFPDANNPNKILRDDGVEIIIETLTENSARLVFTIAGRNEGGRTEGLIGKWVFEIGL